MVKYKLFMSSHIIPDGTSVTTVVCRYVWSQCPCWWGSHSPNILTDNTHHITANKRYDSHNHIQLTNSQYPLPNFLYDLIVKLANIQIDDFHNPNHVFQFCNHFILLCTQCYILDCQIQWRLSRYNEKILHADRLNKKLFFSYCIYS